MSRLCWRCTVEMWLEAAADFVSVIGCRAMWLEAVADFVTECCISAAEWCDLKQQLILSECYRLQSNVTWSSSWFCHSVAYQLQSDVTRSSGWFCHRVLHIGCRAMWLGWFCHRVLLIDCRAISLQMWLEAAVDFVTVLLIGCRMISVHVVFVSDYCLAVFALYVVWDVNWFISLAESGGTSFRGK